MKHTWCTTVVDHAAQNLAMFETCLNAYKELYHIDEEVVESE